MCETNAPYVNWMPFSMSFWASSILSLENCTMWIGFSGGSIAEWWNDEEPTGACDVKGSSIAWSHMVCLGSLCNCSSLKTLPCFMYSDGIFIDSISWAIPMVALQSRSCSIFIVCGLLMVWGMNHALAASEALNTIGSCVWSTHPLFQSIFGCTMVN